MIELGQIITFLMLGGVILGVLCGYPLALVVGGIALLVGYLFGGVAVFDVLYLRMYTLLQTYVFIAVPLFVFMGLMLERSGITERMYSALYLWLGGFRGGLAVITVLIGTILAACMGIITASVTLLTLIALPSMIKRGYAKGLASGSVCAGGTLGILIPPSVMLVVYGPMAGISVGKLFMGAFAPGLLLAVLYCTYISLRSLQPGIAPPVPREERTVPLIKKTTMLLTSLVPPVILILGVLGTIFFGLAPPTEAAGVGAFCAVLLTVVYRRFNWQALKEATLETLRVTGFVMIIGAMAYMFVGVFISLGCGEVVQNLILAAPGGRWGAFAVVMFIVFILGFAMEWLGIVFIIVPIVSPLVPELGFDPVWFAIMVCTNLQMAFMTPPFAGAIFVCRGAAAEELQLKIGDIMRGVIPFVGCIILGLGFCVAFPDIILWLPSQMVK